MKNSKTKLKTIIGENTTIKGDVNAANGVLINGNLEGSIKTTGTVSVGGKGSVKGSIESSETNIFGKVEGNITSTDFIELHDKSNVVGDLIAPKLKIEEGATLNGNCSMNSSKDKIKVKKK